VVFNNLTDDPTGSAIKALGIVGGAAVQDLGAVVARSAEEGANVWTVSPPATGWPAGAAVAVSVGPTAVDRYGHTLAAAVTDTFTVKP
jgi:hypothetical protein